jgi:endo-1,4-beta-xylanase
MTTVPRFTRFGCLGLSVALILGMIACTRRVSPLPPTAAEPLAKLATTTTGTPAARPSPTLDDTSTEPTGLRELAEARGLAIGAAVQVSALGDEAYASLLAREFNLVVPETAMSFKSTRPDRSQFDFSLGDQVVAFAQVHHMAVRGQVLVWDHQLPDWVVEGNFSRKEWLAILKEHIQTTVNHYRGKVVAWDVVNEAIDDNGLLRDTIWLRNIGPEYIALAFRWAHEADPDVLLFYNDHLGESLNRKSQAIYALASGLLQAGVPIDGIGMQMHTWLEGPPASDELAANMQRLADLGLRVQITEMDVRTQFHPSTDEAEKLDLQADMYRRVIETCLAAPNCDTFITWGLTDRYSWIPGFSGKPDIPLLFDVQGKPKPAYEAVRQALEAP